MYEYENEREKLFTDKGQVLFLLIRDNVKRLLEDAGAFQCYKAWDGVHGDSWGMLACIDRLVELEEIRCVYSEAVRQYWVYV